MNSRPVRVLVMLEAYTITGSAKGVLEFAREAARQTESIPQFVLTLVTFRRGEHREQPVLRNAIEELNVNWDVLEERKRFDLNAIERLREIQHATQSDVILSNSVKSHFLVRYLGLQRQCGWVAFHHGYTTTDLKMLLYNQLDRWSLQRADRSLTVCGPFAEQLQHYGVPPERIRIQHMPIRPMALPDTREVDRIRSRLKLRPEEKVIFTAGRLSKEKGHADLLRGFARVRSCSPVPLRLVIAGEGPERAKLAAVAQNLGVEDAVVLAGHQDHLAPFFAIADVFVLSSHSEGSPNVLLEAAAFGVPIVATMVGGVPELVQHDRDALLIPKSDERAMAAAIQRMFEDRVLAQRLSTAARGVLGLHTPAAYYRAVADVLLEAAQIGANRRKQS